MEKTKFEKYQIIWAKVISVLFHPLFMPLYGVLIIFMAPTLFWYLPFKVKRIIFLIILINNVLIPISLLPFFRHRNIVNSLIMEERTDRIIPLLAASLLYSITSFVLFRLQIPVFLKTWFYSISFLSVLLLLITLWYKVSIHSAAAGALIGTILALSLKMSVSLGWFFITSLVISGFVLASRLRLNLHNPLQVYTGFIAGLAGISLFILFFQ
jgi:membrane-associated phospholipid phosphatase